MFVKFPIKIADIEQEQDLVNFDTKSVIKGEVEGIAVINLKDIKDYMEASLELNVILVGVRNVKMPIDMTLLDFEDTLRKALKGYTGNHETLLELKALVEEDLD